MEEIINEEENRPDNATNIGEAANKNVSAHPKHNNTTHMDRQARADTATPQITLITSQWLNSFPQRSVGKLFNYLCWCIRY